MMQKPLTPGPIVPPPFDYAAAKILEDGRIVCLMRMFSTVRITLGTDWTGWSIGWDFEDVVLAISEYEKFNGTTEPNGWVRCMDRGKPHRRRRDGTKESEFGDVEHGSLTPARDESNKFASICPYCNEGMLMVVREPVTFVLQEFDVCTLCGQRVKYSDIADLRRKDWAR